MKKMKKLASLMLALVMALCLAAPAFAADATNSITINNAANGETYKTYKLLDLSVNEAKDSFTYTLPENGAFNNLFTAENSIFRLNEEGAKATVELKAETANDSDAIKAFAQSAAALVTGTTAVAGEATAANGTAKIENLQPGYYLVISSMGTIAMIDTTPTDPDAQINEKNTAPTIEKEIVTVTGNQPSIGDSVSYKVTIHAKAGAENYVLTDKMSTGLTFNNDVAVTVNETAIAATNYTVNTDVTDATFTVTFTKAYLETLTADTDIVVTYSATINADAVNVNGMTNSAKLNYGNHSETGWTDITDATTSKIFGFDLVKTNSKDEVLSGAKFELYASDAEGANAIKLVAVEGGYRVANGNEEGAATTIEAGNVWIDGLGAGTYYLKETQAPEGYNAIKDMKKIEVSADNKATVDNGKYTTGGIEVENLTGAELPSTGGIGTTIFYTVGGLLVVGAGVLLVVKKRMTTAD